MQAPHIQNFKFHVNFLLLMSFQLIRMSPRSCVWFIITLSTYDDELLAPCQTPKLEEHLLSAVQDALCSIPTAIFHIRRPSPQSKT